MAETEDAPDLKSGDPMDDVGSTPTAATIVPAGMGGIQMKVICEKLDCGKPAIVQARFGEVAVARVCLDHELDLVEFINRYIGASEPGLGTQPVTQNGTT